MRPTVQSSSAVWKSIKRLEVNNLNSSSDFAASSVNFTQLHSISNNFHPTPVNFNYSPSISRQFYSTPLNLSVNFTLLHFISFNFTQLQTQLQLFSSSICRQLHSALPNLLSTSFNSTPQLTQYHPTPNNFNHFPSIYPQFYLTPLKLL